MSAQVNHFSAGLYVQYCTNFSGGSPLPKAPYKVPNLLSSDLCFMLTSLRAYLAAALMRTAYPMNPT